MAEEEDPGHIRRRSEAIQTLYKAARLYVAAQLAHEDVHHPQQVDAACALVDAALDLTEAV